MLKVPTVDICIESPNQSEYVDIVSNEKQNQFYLGHGSYGRVYKAIYRGTVVLHCRIKNIVLRNITVTYFSCFRSTGGCKDYTKDKSGIGNFGYSGIKYSRLEP